MKDIIINNIKFKDIPENFDDITITKYSQVFENITEEMNYIEQQVQAVSVIYGLTVDEVYNIHGDVFAAMVDEI
jgi:hypothetical protein